MEVVKISDTGQITVPISVRNKLRLKKGDKVEFIEENGRFYLENAGLAAYKQLTEDFEGEAEKAGFHNEDELMEYLHDFRKKFRRSWNARNA